MENNDSLVVSENIKEENEIIPENPENEMSKRARKRLAKKLKWENRKAGKRLKERQKRKERIAAAIEQNIKLGPSRKQLKASKMANSKCRTSVVIDMSFDGLMSEKVSNSKTHLLFLRLVAVKCKPQLLTGFCKCFRTWVKQ